MESSAEQAAEAVTEAAAGFKAEHVEPEDKGDEPLEAQVVSVENAAGAELEEPAQAAAAEKPAGAEPEEGTGELDEPARCASCGAAVEPHHKFCTNCGQPL